MVDAVDVSEVVVTGYYWPTFSQTGTCYTPVGPGVGPQMMLTQYASQYGATPHVTVSTTDNSAAAQQAIADLANTGASNFACAAMNASNNSATTVAMPDASPVAFGTIANILNNTTYVITDTNYGPGRAGENMINTTTGKITVEININDLKGYDSITGGLNYLVLHEVGHDVAGAVAEETAMWNQYLQEPGVSAQSYADQVANYPSSQEFQTNEAWSNSAGQSIAHAIGVQWISVVPNYGYY
jgi:hypothetical protein